MDPEKPVTANIVTKDGKPLMSLKSLSVVNGRIKICGALMGQWDSEMYMEPKELVNIAQIVMNSPDLLACLIDLPKTLKANKAAEE